MPGRHSQVRPRGDTRTDRGGAAGARDKARPKSGVRGSRRGAGAAGMWDRGDVGAAGAQGVDLMVYFGTFLLIH